MAPIVCLLVFVIVSSSAVSANKHQLGRLYPEIGPRFDPLLSGKINKELFRTLLLITASKRANASPAGKVVTVERTAHQLAAQAKHWARTSLTRINFDGLYEREILRACDEIVPIHMAHGKEINEIVIMRPELRLTNEGRVNRIAKLCSFLELEETREDIFNRFTAELLSGT